MSTPEKPFGVPGTSEESGQPISDEEEIEAARTANRFDIRRLIGALFILYGVILTVALLAGVTPRVHDRRLVAALFGLLTGEARHAAWARHIVGSTPVPEAFDHARSLGSVDKTLDRTRFIVGAPKTTAKRRPGFTG